MQTRFLLGPAGSGKTFRCLAEVRAELQRNPDGAPLIFVAPKQATFQLERQLLADGSVSGFSRLRILSFDRLAQFVFDELHFLPPNLLSAEGRLMVLRALLRQHADELKLLRASSRRPGFAQELGALLAELQQHQIGPAKIRALAANEKLRRELRDKLLDLALLAEKYRDRLHEHELQDSNNLLDLATDALRKKFEIQNLKFGIDGLWLDGFAEMTPQELSLLAAVIPFCQNATLAFCLKNAAPAESWLSIWSAIGKTFQKCRDRIGALPDCVIEKIEPLERVPGHNRFAPDTDLDVLEESWSLPVANQESRNPTQISVTACANPEAEAIFAAREIIFPPFEKFYDQLNHVHFQPNGTQLAVALRDLWKNVEAEQNLEVWSAGEAEQSAIGNRQSAIHLSVLEQMNSWLDNVALAFPHEQMSLRDWLPIVETGLGNLTVGVIPPALDEVLVGAIDRARNPDLKFALLLGVNESVFPAAPSAPVILTSTDRDELENQNAPLSANRLDQISRERYLGYIACTRANEKLTLTFSRQNADGKTLNPSPFIAQLQRNFPQLEIEEFSEEADWRTAEHVSELAPIVARSVSANGSAANLLEIPALKLLAEKLARLREPDEKENLSPAFADKIYGPILKSSVSRLEEFAQCPFRFFVRSGLRANERKIFELDARERGNFQHDVLKIFHELLMAEGKRWRDLAPTEARACVGEIAAAQMEHFGGGLFRDSVATAFAARAMASALQDFVEVIVGWMRSQYDFDPVAAELGFGGKDDAAPAWEIELGNRHKLALQGRIDRVDLWRDAKTQAALAVVTDYKSGGKKLDSLLVANGIQLQLLAYLGALRHWKNPQPAFGADEIIPVGAFYVNLRGEFKTGDSRDEVLSDAEARKLAYRHNGRFDASELKKLDRRDVTKGDQFNFRLNKDGRVSSNSAEAIACKEFTALLDQVEAQLKLLGKKIFSGAAAVDPFRKGSVTACDFCDYRAACRLDEWTHEWRVLRAETNKDEP